jgi:hypothetical protein
VRAVSIARLMACLSAPLKVGGSYLQARGNVMYCTKQEFLSPLRERQRERERDKKVKGKGVVRDTFILGEWGRKEHHLLEGFQASPAPRFGRRHMKMKMYVEDVRMVPHTYIHTHTHTYISLIQYTATVTADGYETSPLH